MGRAQTFLFPRRVRRIDFLLRFLACVILTQLLYTSMPLSASAVSAPSFVAWWIAAVFLGVYALFFVFLPRLRDAAMSEWWLVLALFPFVNLLLALFLLFRARASDSRTHGD